MSARNRKSPNDPGDQLASSEVDPRCDPHAAAGPFPIVGIGASAGGLDAVSELLQALPSGLGMAFVLVQHLEPHHESELAGILSRFTKMPVRQVHDRDKVEPDHLYVIPPNTVMTLESGVLRLAPRDTSTKPNLPIDSFFVSLAEDQGSNAIAIILSGSASDGAQGIRAIKARDGITLCQDENSAKFGGMPHSAAATGAVDFVLPPKEIAAELARIRSHPYIMPSDRVDGGLGFVQGDRDLRKIFQMLRAASKVDFSNYKQSTIRRRIGRRMLVHQKTSLGEYAEFLQENPSEVVDLYRDILICVTSFFREPSTFQALGRAVSDILSKRESDDPFRIWVAGSATGEEAYSIAIAVFERIDAAKLRTPIQLFGTDISEIAIDRARAGVYAQQIETELTPERLHRFFTRIDAGYRISQAIRDQCVFARHDLTADPPFSQMDLVSCRNVLIYLGPQVQQRILPALHYSLKQDGLLMLGSAETVGNRTDLFAVVDSESKIYSKKLIPARLGGLDFLPPRSFGGMIGEDAVGSAAAMPSLEAVEARASRLQRDVYAPPGVIVSESLQILHFQGQTGFYLEQPTGAASLHLLHLARETLRYTLRKTLDRAIESNEAVLEPGVRVTHNRETREINLRVIPFAESKIRYCLVLFEPVPAPAGKDGKVTPPAAPKPNDTQLQIQQAQQEVVDTRDYLRKIVEQHEVATEELKAANEEVRSSNEELQSTNEELRTAKEELQSSNEELMTVNDELKHRNDELNAANSDLSNVFNAVNLPIAMVSLDLRLRRFTPAAERLLNIVASDIGRLITDIPIAIDVPGLGGMLVDSIQTLAVRHCMAQSRESRWYSATVRPYRTVDDRIDGAVVTLIDVDDVTRARERAESARDFAEGIVESVQHPLIVLDADLRIQQATTSFYTTFQLTPEETEGRLIAELSNQQWRIPNLRSLLEEALHRDVPFRDLEVDHDFPRIGRRSLRLNARRIVGRDDTPRTVLLAIEDVTDRKEAAEIQYRRLFESSKDGFIVLDSETGRIIDVNPYFTELTRYPRTDLVGRLFGEIPCFLSSEEAHNLVPEARERDAARYDGVRLLALDGRELFVDILANRYRVKDQGLIQVNIRDVTGRKRTEEQLRRYNLDLQQFAFAASHDLQEPLRTMTLYLDLFKRDYRGKLGAEAEEMIGFVTTAAARMRQMVLDLLAYSQVSQADRDVEHFSMETALATTMLNLQLAINNSGAIITFDHLPVVAADSMQLVHLFQNLIGNAIKYRGEEAPRIHIGARQAGGEWTFSVQDNGIGIDPAYADHIFTVFKRLHGTSYPGTGIGLAICKRIVERHHGRIWVESQPGKGSTFYFTLPVPTSGGGG